MAPHWILLPPMLSSSSQGKLVLARRRWCSRVDVLGFPCTWDITQQGDWQTFIFYLFGFYIALAPPEGIRALYNLH